MLSAGWDAHFQSLAQGALDKVEHGVNMYADALKGIFGAVAEKASDLKAVVSDKIESISQSVSNAVSPNISAGKDSPEHGLGIGKALQVESPSAANDQFSSLSLPKDLNLGMQTETNNLYNTASPHHQSHELGNLSASTGMNYAHHQQQQQSAGLAA